MMANSPSHICPNRRPHREAPGPNIVGHGRSAATFVAACSHVWTRLIEACEEADETVYFSFVGDCRARIDPPLADTYLGNCISGVLCEASRAELTGLDGLVMASNIIHQGIRTLEGRQWSGRGKWPANTLSCSVRGSSRLPGLPIYYRSTILILDGVRRIK